MNNKTIYFENKEYKKIIRSSKKIIEKNINQNISQKETYVEIILDNFTIPNKNSILESNEESNKNKKSSVPKDNKKIKTLILNFGGTHE